MKDVFNLEEIEATVFGNTKNKLGMDWKDKVVKCGYCSKELQDNKCKCGGVFDGEKFTHPKSPTLYYTPNKAGSVVLNRLTGEWENDF